MLDLAAANLLSPIVLSFALGLIAALARSDLSVPEAVAKGLSIYLLFAIGFKGGVAVAEHGVGLSLGLAIGAGVAMSFVLPFIAFGLLRGMSRMGPLDAAAVAAHYGSISIVTFVAGTSVVEAAGFKPEGFMVAVAAAMEAPAILSALWLAARTGKAGGVEPGLWREIMLNGSIVLLIGAFAIGWITGPKGLSEVAPLLVAPFKGVLCLFLLDMGLVAGRGLRGGGKVLDRGAIVFALVMPLIGGAAGAILGAGIGLSTGGIALLAILGASGGYIAVPAAMRVAMPEANPSIYLTLSLGVTFPFNLTIGLPIYLWMAQTVSGG